MILRYIVEENNIILKDYLKKKNIFANTQKDIKQLNGQYLVNDQIVENWFLLKQGDLLEIVLPASIQGNNITSVKGDLKILFEDSYLLILEKDNNIASIPTREHYDASLANHVMSYYKRKGIVSNIHFVGRLDYATSGIIMLAKNPYMMALMKNIEITKKYYLETKGIIEKNSGIITGGIIKDPTSIIKRTLSKDFINSKTTYEVIKRKDSTTIVLATLHTGKTHQLRLHFSSIGYPIIGDELYGDKEKDDILHLHSCYLKFLHPVTNEVIEINSKPKWFTD